MWSDQYKSETTAKGGDEKGGGAKKEGEEEKEEVEEVEEKEEEYEEWNRAQSNGGSAGRWSASFLPVRTDSDVLDKPFMIIEQERVQKIFGRKWRKNFKLKRLDVLSLLFYLYASKDAKFVADNFVPTHITYPHRGFELWMFWLSNAIASARAKLNLEPPVVAMISRKWEINSKARETTTRKKYI